MQRSTERILTTHTGSLPRPDNLVQLMIAREQGKSVDATELADSVRNAVAEVVKHQVDVGIDIISDGEMSKIGFANYVKDRLTGFGGESNPVVAQDVLDHPDTVRGKQVLDIVKMKQKDLNATNEEAAFRVVAGTARSMGIEVVG